ncbi:MAG: MerR family transcriptional regulator [Candidatus Latescibacteria bacterium]|nr:MerR family transcriptional regulator [Candidatus Latescibacterota bacterium]
MKNPLQNKLYYSISEVAELTQLQPYTLRAWEKEFACLRPNRARGGKNRAYRERDIGIILLLKRLLYEERYTTQGVKKKLKDEPELLRQVGEQVSVLLTKQQDSPASVVERTDPELAQDREAAFRMIEETKKELREILRLL